MKVYLIHAPFLIQKTINIVLIYLLHIGHHVVLKWIDEQVILDDFGDLVAVWWCSVVEPFEECDGRLVFRLLEDLH